MAGEGQKAKIVVVGGGVGGSYIARILQSDADVVLIDPKEYFEIPWLDLRAKVEPAFMEKGLIRHADYLPQAKVIIAHAKGITESAVLTDKGDEVPYDYLVIATGHADPVPLTVPARLEQFKKENKTIESSGSILIVGGGPTGVELAGEIATDYPDKKVTLVHKGPRLMEFLGPKAAAKALKWLKAHRVQVLLDQSVDLSALAGGAKEVTTSAGTVVAADSHFICIGSRFGSAWLRETFLKDEIDAHGQLIVDAHLRARGHKNIFAIGDITNAKELKLGFIAKKHAGVVAKNLKLLIAGGDEAKLEVNKPMPEVGIVSLGRNNGVVQLPFATFTGFLPRNMKSKTLLVDVSRKALGLKD